MLEVEEVERIEVAVEGVLESGERNKMGEVEVVHGGGG